MRHAQAAHAVVMPREAGDLLPSERIPHVAVEVVVAGED